MSWAGRRPDSASSFKRLLRRWRHAFADDLDRCPWSRHARWRSSWSTPLGACSVSGVHLPRGKPRRRRGSA